MGALKYDYNGVAVGFVFLCFCSCFMLKVEEEEEEEEVVFELQPNSTRFSLDVYHSVEHNWFHEDNELLIISSQIHPS